MDITKLCKGCMNQTLIDGLCPKCGFNETTYKSSPHHLKPGTVLGGKYLFGKTLGEGGFGITYIGIDLNLNLRVAIKEYFPSGCVTRDTSITDTITVFSGNFMDSFNSGKKKFVEEAQRLAQFNDSDGIVSVKDFFLENGTAYIVMEYLEGETLKDFLNRRGGTLSVANALDMIKPIMKSLSLLHKNGVIHRDISPDNIILTNNKVKLIDFGAARDISANANKSLSVQLKPGYAPEEQYRSHGNQGPWTDVYALCATIYRMITGRVPMESLERLRYDRLAPPSTLGINILPRIESALMAGLAVDYKKRPQSVDELYNAIYTNNNTSVQTSYTPPQVQQNNNPPSVSTNKNNDKSMIKLIATLSIIPITALVIVIALAATGVIGIKSTTISKTIKPTQTPKVTYKPTPLPTESVVETIRPDLYNPSLTYKRMNNIHNSSLVDDYTFEQLEYFIMRYNNLCVDYMNNGNTSVLQYISSGSTAYSQQTNYKKKHPDIYEILNYVEVINARYDGSSYYLWVTEDRTVTENGTTKNTVDHWVYRIESYGSQYMVADYTRDPAY